MKLCLLLAFILSVSTVGCGTTTEPVPEPVQKPVPEPVPEPARPSAVQIRDVSANDGTVTITFTHTSSASIQYRVTCQSSSGNNTATGSASPITTTGLTNGIRYSCTVTAFDLNASSDPSTAVFVTPGAPQYKALLYLLTPGNGSATANYEKPNEFLGDPRPSFVALTCNGGGSTLTATSADSVTAPITIKGLQNGVTYSCTLRVTSASGVGISELLDVVPGTPVRPLAPTATPGNASVTISFQPSADNGFPVTSYTATCGAAGQQSRTVNGTSSPLVVTGLTNGTVYSCNVYGSNAVGPGEKQASITVTPGIPSAVKSVTATTTSNSATFSFSQPDSDNGSPITSYTITCGMSVNGPPGSKPPPPTASGPASPITVTGMLANTFYTCSVFATNANGNGPTTSVGVSTKP